MNKSFSAHIQKIPVFLWLILFCSLLVRIWGIWGWAFNSDEMQFLIIAKGASLGEVWQRGLAELHPPLANFIHHYLLMISSDFFVQRLFSVAAGVVSVLGMYYLGLLLKDEWLGLFLAFCMAFSPVAVSTSMTYRNYAFFMPLLIFSLCAFIRYQREHKAKDLIWFTCLIFLSCNTHFTGFLVAAACGLTEGVLLLHHHKAKTLLVWCASFIPLTLLAVFFYLHYLAPGTIGPVWKNYALQEQPDSYSNFTQRLSFLQNGIIAYFFPLLPFDLESFFLHHTIILAIFFTLSLIVIALYIISIYKTFYASRQTALLIIFTWLMAFGMLLAGYYPLSPNRQSLYLLPFYILPFGFLFHPLITRWKIVFLLCVIFLSAIFSLLAISGIYLNYNEEFSLKRQSVQESYEYLDSKTVPGDVLITGRFGYPYLLFGKDGGVTSYTPYSDIPYSHRSLILSPFDSPYRPYEEDSFHLWLKNDVPSDAHKQTQIWFIQYGWKNDEIWNLMDCLDRKNKISNFFSRDGVVIFSVQASALMAFVHNDALWQKCYANYQHSPKGDIFSAINRTIQE